MAKRQLEVTIVIKDHASKGLDDVKRKIKRTGDAANKASFDFGKFNKTLFATGAFVGLFAKSFNTLRASLDSGAELDRLAGQYERTLGPKGRLFEAISSMTTTSVSKMDAMRSALDLAQLGVVSNSQDAATLIAKAGTAAKLAGRDAGAGVEAFTNFMKTGEVGQLEFLNLIARTNPALQAQLAILNKAGGVMGTVLSTQAKLAMGQALLEAATKGNLKGSRDLKDIMVKLDDTYGHMKSTIGTFIGSAIGPLIDKFASMFDVVSKNLEGFIKNNKNLVYLTKVAILATGALVGLVATLGTLKLIITALSYAGIGLPALITSILFLGTAFLGITSKAEGLVNKLELFGGLVRGIIELVQNLDTNTGLSKMSKSVHELLKKNGLLGVAETLARIISVGKRVAQDIVQAFKWMSDTLDNIFGGISSKIVGYIDSFKKPWSKWWIDDSITGVEKFGRAFTAIMAGIAGFWAVKKIFGLVSGGLSKLPVIGKYLGGSSNQPKGSKSDPIYTRSADGLSSGLSGGFGGAVLDSIFGKKIGSIFDRIISRGGIIGKLFNLPRLLASSWGALGNTIKAIFGQVGSILARTLISAAPMMAKGFSVVAAGALGYALGSVLEPYIDKITGKTSEGFEYSGLGGMFFKLDKLFNGEASKRFMEAEEKFKNAGTPEAIAEQRSKMAAKKSETPKLFSPNMSIGQVDSLDSLGEQMKTMSQAEKDKYKEAVEQAFMSSSQGGTMLTAEEMNNLMNKNPSVDYLKQISENTKPESTIMSSPKSRRP